MWEMGRGESISLRNDNWLPGHTYFKIIQPQQGGWNSQLVLQAFHSIDVEKILKIPFPLIPANDNSNLTWLPAKDGIQEAKGYWFAFLQVSTMSLNLPESSSTPLITNRDL